MFDITPQYAPLIDRVKTLLGIGDWTVTCRRSSEDSENIAWVETRLDYCEAVITIYDKSLEQVREDGFAESIERLIVHELCEVAVEDSIRDLEENIRECEWMMRVRDQIADRMRRTLERGGVLVDGKRITPDLTSLHDIDLGVPA